MPASRCRAIGCSQRVWGFDFNGDERTIDVHVHRLRAKIEDAVASAAAGAHGPRVWLQVRAPLTSEGVVREPGAARSRDGCDGRARAENAAHLDTRIPRDAARRRASMPRRLAAFWRRRVARRCVWGAWSTACSSSRCSTSDERRTRAATSSSKSSATIDMVAPLAAARRVTIRTHLPASAPALVDGDACVHALANLVENAVKHGSERRNDRGLVQLRGAIRSGRRRGRRQRHRAGAARVDLHHGRLRRAAGPRRPRHRPCGREGDCRASRRRRARRGLSRSDGARFVLRFPAG